MDFVYVNCTCTYPFPLRNRKPQNQIHISHNKNVPLQAQTSLYPFLHRRIRRRRSKKCLAVRISNFAASATERSANGAATRRSLTATGGDESSAFLFGKSSDAMEQLDIERGVCMPFRKYTPETVWNLHPLEFWWKYWLVFCCFCCFLFWFLCAVDNPGELLLILSTSIEILMHIGVNCVLFSMVFTWFFVKSHKGIDNIHMLEDAHTILFIEICVLTCYGMEFI